MPKVHGVGQIIEETIRNISISPVDEAYLGITDDRLANIASPGKVLNSATTATVDNQPNTIVLRDSSGAFSVAKVLGILDPANGGTGVDNTGKTITLGGSFSTTLNSVTFNVPSAANLTLPSVGTLATLDDINFAIQGLDYKESVLQATTGPLPPAVYDNGVLTAQITGILPAQDGMMLIPGARFLVKDQADPRENGIYVVTNIGSLGSFWVLTRSSDADGTPENEVSAGMYTFVERGDQNGGNSYIVLGQGNLIVGTDPINITQFSGAGQLITGAGLGKDGNEIFLLDVSTPGTFNSVTINSKGQVVNGNNYTTLSSAGLTGVLSNLIDVTTTSVELNELHGAQIELTDFQKLVAITKTANEINDLVTKTELSSVTAGQGASLVGVVPISGVNGDNLQQILESLVTALQGVATELGNQVPFEFVGEADGVQQAWNTAFPYVPGTLRAYANGILMNKGTGPEEFQETDPGTGAFLFGYVPNASTTIMVAYTKA